MDNSAQSTSSNHDGGLRDDQVVYVLPSDVITRTARDEIDIFDLWNIVWSGKWQIAAITAVVAMISVVYALTAPEMYRAEVLLSPTSEHSSQDLIGGLGGLASLAGLNLRGIGNETVEALAVLRSRDFTREFIEEENLLTVLFADDWDEQAKAWRSDDPADHPDLRDAVKFFDESIRTVEELATGLVLLRIEWTDPEVAADWANSLVQRLNARMRERALVDAQKNVDYLREQLAKTNLVTLQESISRLLESEMQKLMLANGNEQFSFRVIDRAEVPKYRSSPKRTLIVCFATVFGGFVSILIVLVRHAIRIRRGATS